MLSLKNIIIVGSIIAATYYYSTHVYESSAFKAYKRTFEEDCIQNLRDKLEEEGAAALATPLCKCIIQKPEMQKALRAAYNTNEDSLEADSAVAASLFQAFPSCLQEVATHRPS